MCPECNAPLVALELNGIEIDYCVKCGGIWLDRGELAMIAEMAGIPSGRISEALLEQATRGPGKGRCPRCGAPLKSVVIRDEPLLEIDRCPNGHGLYFDKGELQATVACVTGCGDRELDNLAEFFDDMFKYHLTGRGEGVDQQ
jgi:Zn-finger nucleic acid-binding protein